MSSLLPDHEINVEALKRSTRPKSESKNHIPKTTDKTTTKIAEDQTPIPPPAIDIIEKEYLDEGGKTKTKATLSEYNPSTLPTNLQAKDIKYNPVDFGDKKQNDYSSLPFEDNIKVNITDVENNKINPDKIRMPNFLDIIGDIIGSTTSGAIGKDWEHFADRQNKIIDKKYDRDVSERNKNLEVNYKNIEKMLNQQRQNNQAINSNNTNLQQDYTNKADEDKRILDEFLQLSKLKLTEKELQQAVDIQNAINAAKVMQINSDNMQNNNENNYRKTITSNDNIAKGNADFDEIVATYNTTYPGSGYTDPTPPAPSRKGEYTLGSTPPAPAPAPAPKVDIVEFALDKNNIKTMALIRQKEANNEPLTEKDKAFKEFVKVHNIKM